MDREERLGKNRAVLAALSIPSLAAETRTPDETGDGSRRRGRTGASASTAPSRRSSRAEARKAKTYADAPGEDSGDRASDDSDAGSDSARARAEEEADADFSGSESESESARRARGDAPETVELDEDGEEIKKRAPPATDRRGFTKKRERARDEPPTRRLSRESDASDDARDAFAAFLAPSAAVAVRRGFLKLEDATFGLRELRAVVDAHGFEDWTDEELVHMLAPELVKAPEADPSAGSAEEARRRDALVTKTSPGAAGTDPSAADAARRAAAAAAAAEMRLGLSDLARLAETVGARRRAT